jgi:hypothetical protein
MSEIAFGRTRNRSLLGTLNALRVHGAGPECAAARTRDVGGADAVPGAGADSPAGRRESDRVDASCVPRQVAGTFASLRYSIVRERLGAST